MPAITTDAPAPLGPPTARFGEGPDNPDHRAEEAEEGRVVAERAEEGEPALVGEPALGDGAGHRLLDGGGAAIGSVERRARHLGLEAATVLDAAPRLLQPSFPEEREEVWARQSTAGEVQGSLEDDGDRRDGEADEEQHHPLRAGAREELEEGLRHV